MGQSQDTTESIENIWKKWGKIIFTDTLNILNFLNYGSSTIFWNKNILPEFLL